MMPTDLAQLSVEQKRLLAKQLLQQRAVANISPAGERDKGDRALTLPSFAQQRLWFLDQLYPNSSVYVLSGVFRLVGDIDRDRLRRCLNQTLQRHEILRTVYILQEEQVYQKVVAVEFDWYPVDVDLQSGIASGDHDTVQTAIERLTQLPFNLAQAPLLRAQLFQCGTSEFQLVLAVHHIAADYQSLRILLQEMVQIYHGRSLNPLPQQYGDYANWQRQQHQRLTQQSEYWQQQLSNLPQGLPLSIDYPRPTVMRHSGDVYLFTLSSAVSEQLRQLSRLNQVTLFMTLLTAFKVLLYRYSGQSDLLVGSTIDQRHRPELQPLIGLFVNNLVFRSQIEGDQPFSDLLKQIRQTCLDAYENQDLPFEQLVGQLPIERQLNQNPLFQVAFVLHSSSEQFAAIKLPQMQLEYLPQSQQVSRFDLSLDMDDRLDGLVGRWEYSTEIFAASTIQQIATHFEALLTAIVADPHQPINQIQLLSQFDLDQLEQWNCTDCPVEIDSVIAGFQHTVRQFPDSIAVEDGTNTFSYHELNEQSDRLAAWLQAQGVAFGDRVGVMLDRTVNLPLALIAVLKLGAIYVPIDSSYPSERIQHMINDSGLTYLLNDQTSQDLPATVTALQISEAFQQFVPTIFPTIQPNDSAYVIYTSGSTGKPKGVEVLHRGLANILADLKQKLDLQPHDRWLAVTTIAFDIAALELFLPLMVGATVVIARQQNDANALADCLIQQQITIMQATPATWRLLLETDWSGSDSLNILCGGEALDRHLAHQLLTKSRQVWNLYGPTETTIWSAADLVNFDCDHLIVMPISQPIANTAFYVLDDSLQPVPLGVPGQLYIGGEGLAKGYWGRPELTAEKFVEYQGKRLYATGDRVKRLTDGRLAYLGRLDFQVKLRGYRIELGEIEAAMTDVSGVMQSVATILGEGAQQRLIGYYQMQSGLEEASQTIAQHLRSRLPSYMQPSELIAVEAMPLTPNGKVDRLALAQIKSFKHDQLDPNARSLPQTDSETKLAEIWRDLLGIDVAYREDDFFAIGGHSLLAMRLAIQIRQQFAQELSLQAIFSYSQLSSMADHLEQQASTTAPMTLPQHDITAPLPLSLAQRRFWLLHQLAPESTAYHIPIVLKLSGQINAEKLQHCFEQVIQRHEILRTRYIPVNPGAERSDAIVQAVAEPFDAAQFNFSTSIADDCNDLTQPIQALIQTPFCLETDYPIRVQHFTDQTQSTLVIVLHHIAADAASINLLLAELAQIYQGNRLPELTRQYSDFAAWQQNSAQVNARSQQLAYWQQQLENASMTLDLPTDSTAYTETSQPVAKIQRSTISSVLTKRLQMFCQAENITLYMLLLASYGMLLSRYSGNLDLLIGSPITNRCHAEIEPLIGCFANTIVLRIDQRGQPTVRELLQRVKQTTIAAYEHQDLPFEQLVDVLQPERSIAQHPIFQTMLVLQNAEPARAISTSSTTWEIIDIDQAAAKFDLLVNFSETASGLQGRWEYDAGKFDEATVSRMVDNFQHLLEQIIQSPDALVDRLPIVCPQELQQLAIWNQTQRNDALFTLPELFTVQAAKTPSHSAIIDGDRTLSYTDLEVLVSQFSSHLQQHLSPGIQPAQRTIGIFLERRAEAIAAMLAVMQLGCVYVPIDVSYPADRVQYLIEDAAVCCVITQSSLAKQISEWVSTIVIEQMQQPVADVDLTNSLPQIDDLAYLIYTSGSTGQPKGVAIQHSNVASLIAWAKGTFSPSALQGVLASTSFCFDLSIFEIFVPLSLGGCIILADNLLALPNLPAAKAVTLINTVPSVMQALLQLAQPFPMMLQVVNLAGEALSASLVQQLYQIPQVQQVYNLYGPSEDTTYSTYALVERNQQTSPTIGQPISNTQIYILDPQQQLLPIGAIGELYLAGSGVARGYWQRPELTAERFFQVMIQGESLRLYRTGDRVRWRQDGTLEYLGRFDFQVKLRGFRIELGEIEHCLESHPDIDRAIVLLSHQPNTPQLFAFYLGDNHAVSSSELRQHLMQQLPSHMVPNHLIALEQLPLTHNGKLDRAALEAHIQRYLAAPAVLANDLALPIDSIEIALLELWQKLLNQAQISRDDNFFELGGDSILAIQMVAAARDRQLHFTPRNLFQFPTIAQLAEVIRINAVASAPLISQQPIIGSVPLAPIQQWFFDQNFTEAHHWNQSLLLRVPQALDADILSQVLGAVIQHHDALRSRFELTDRGWLATITEPEITQEIITQCLSVHDLSDCDDGEDELTAIATKLQASFDLAQAPLLRVVYFKLKRGDRLLFILHHLVTDGLSWRVLLTDWQLAYQQIQRGQTPQLATKTTAYPDWVKTLAHQSDDLRSATQAYWQVEDWQGLAVLPIDMPAQKNQMSDIAAISVELSEALTQQLLQSASQAYQTQINHLLLSALALTLKDWTHHSRFAIELESHGRDGLQELVEIDTSRTIGWFTSLFPVRLSVEGLASDQYGDLIKSIKEQLRRVPYQGVGYGLFRYGQAEAIEPISNLVPLPGTIRFNYLGQTASTIAESGFQIAPEFAGASRSPNANREVAIDINAIVLEQQLKITWQYSSAQYASTTIEQLARAYLNHLERIIQHCLDPDSGGYTPSDFPDMDFSQAELDDFLDSL